MKTKNIVFGVILVGVIGLLVFGALNRTFVKTGSEIGLLNQNVQSASRGGHGQANEVASSKEYGTIEEQQGQGQSQVQGQGHGSGGRWIEDNGSEQFRSEEPPTGQAEVEEWLAVSGVVTEMDPSYLVITADDGTLIEVGGRPLSYIQSQEFLLESGDSVSLQGFYDTEDRFEIGTISNLSTGVEITIRDENGRPMWAGGRRGGQNLDG